LWGGQFWLQPPVRRQDPLESESSGKIARPTRHGLVTKLEELVFQNGFRQDEIE
jgi:hypothetical protein